MKRITINGQDEVIAHNGTANNQVFIEAVNLTSGNITIKATVSGKQPETMKFEEDGSDMVFNAGGDTMQATLPKGNYTITADGSDDINDDVELILQ
ncbi:MAG: hypothetical protein LBD46_08455 [Endomicrobium sp.]|jgi:hypothetical protein|nr:hypothetical protein [Endomicrobium sp.]